MQMYSSLWREAGNSVQRAAVFASCDAGASWGHLLVHSADVSPLNSALSVRVLCDEPLSL